MKEIIIGFIFLLSVSFMCGNFFEIGRYTIKIICLLIFNEDLLDY